MASRCECAARGCQIGRNAYKLSGHGLVRRRVLSWFPPLSAYRMRTPCTVRNWVGMTSLAGGFMMFLLIYTNYAEMHQTSGRPCLGLPTFLMTLCGAARGCRAGLSVR